MIIKTHKQAGFTLVETLVALAILLVAVTGSISLIGDSLHKIYYARDEMVAINLAQEGIEVVRQVRDSNKLGGAATGLASGFFFVDAPSGKLVAWGSCSFDFQVYQDTTGYRQCQLVPGSATPFRRYVVLTLVNTNEMTVASTVSFREPSGTFKYMTVSENLFNWAP